MRRWRAVKALWMVLLLASSAETRAQQGAEPPPNVGVEEIVVTAQKRSELASEVPIAISAFSGEDLQDLGVVDTRDLGKIVPGFSYAESGYSVPIYTLRGVGFNEASQTASATVGIYFDEQDIPFPVMTKGALLDLERVEVLKGPQGTLYGRNSTGGAINYIARKPTDEFEAGIAASLGRFTTSDVEGFVSGPLLGETLRGRIALRDVHSAQGWQESLTRPGDRLGKIDKQAGRAVLDWKVLDRLTTTFTLTGWRDGGEPQAPQVIGFAPQNGITAGALRDLGLDPNLALAPQVRNHPTVPFHSDDNQVADWSNLDWQNDERFAMGAMRSDWSITDSNTITFLASYDRFRNDHSLIPQSGLSVNNTERDLLVKTNAYALELRMDGKIGPVDGLVGGHYSRDHVFEYQSVYVDTDSVTASPIDGSTTITDRVDTKGDQIANTRAIFANANWPFLSAFKLNLGARFTSETRDYSGCVVDSPYQTRGIGFSAVFNALSIAQGGSGGAMKGDCVTLDAQTHDPGLFRGSLSEDNVSGRAAVDWMPIEDELFYASFSRGFKSGSFPVLAASTSAQYVPASQERVHAFELGGKTAFFDRALRVNSATFYYDYKDKQLLGRILDPVFGSLPVLVNVPDSRVIGVELEAQTRPIEGLFVQASGIYLNTKVLSGETFDGQGNRVDLSDRPFTFAPKWVFTLLSDYSRPLGERLVGGVGGTFTYKSETTSTLTGEPLFVIDPYFLVDLRLTVGSADDTWQVAGWVRNATDEFYSNGTFNTGDTVSRYAGMPRTFGGTLTYRY